MQSTEDKSNSLKKSVAALASGGLDSAVMLAHLTRKHGRVHPLYIRCGLVWEDSELNFLARFLEKLGNPRIRSTTELDFSMTDVFAGAWFASGKGIPAYNDPDSHWEIPGRNIVLIAKAAVWCSLHDVEKIALGSLKSNPFPDATVEFILAFQDALSQGLDHPLRIILPFGQLSKADVVRLGRSLPLEMTLSCARPVGDSHCGTCGKCRERINAFQDAGIEDPSDYASRVL